MKTRGALTLVFDDGYTVVYEQVIPLLRQYGVRAVFAVPLNTKEVEGQAITSPQEWLSVAARDGHEVVAHGVTHRSFATLSDRELAQELSGPAETLRTSTLVYPGGAHDDRVVNGAKKYYTAARTVHHGLNDLLPQDSMRLKTINFTKRNFSVPRANIHALRALLQNKWLIETYHMVSSRPSALKHSVLLDDLERHLDFIASLPIKITTIEEHL